MPIPHITKSKRLSKRRGQTDVLSESSYKNQLVEKATPSINKISVKGKGCDLKRKKIRRSVAKDKSTVIVTLCTVVAVANAGYYHAPAVSSQSIIRHDEGLTLGHLAAPSHYAAHPKYDFAYSVSDPHTGDHKSQHESRDGDVVHGSYSL
ncbi:unnamed protein product, partial [Leptidea sinapis]